MRERILIRRLNSSESLRYTNPEILERNSEFIKFKDTRTGKTITVPTSDYQLEEKE